MINMRSCYILCVLAAAVRLTESFSPLTAGSALFARPTTFLVPQHSLLLQQQQQVATRSSFSVRLSATDDDSSESSEAASDNDDSESDSSASNVPPPVPQREAAPRTTPSPKRMDPLLASLTRNNPETKAPTRNVPILGEVAMDKSLPLVGFAVVFAILGFVASVYVAINNQDAFAEALKSNPMLQSAQSAPDGEGCRGICSSQQDDLEQLRVFMGGLGK
jgi:hypothetical protein